MANVAIVGAGYVGRGLLHRIEASPGMRPALVVNRTSSAGVAAYVDAGYEAADVTASDDPVQLATAVGERRPAVSSSLEALTAVAGVDIVVEATGALDFGADAIMRALRAGTDVVSINAEVDATVGHLLHRTARETGAVYTFCDGDQPGVMMRQMQFVEGMGFEVLGAVNCKRHLDVSQTPESGTGYASRDGTSPAVTTSAGDGTKMQIENAVVANVRGFLPDRRGMHGVRTTMEHALRDVLATVSVRPFVDYTLGGDFGAGVFVVARSDEPERVGRYMRFFKMGDGPEYLFFRPYHLVHLEMPITIAEVVLDRVPLGAPSAPPVAEVVAVAKRDLRAGEALDGIGGYTCYGQIDTVAGAGGLLPIGLAAHARVTRPVRRHEAIPEASVELDEAAPIVGLRRLQDDALVSPGDRDGAADVTSR